MPGQNPKVQKKASSSALGKYLKCTQQMAQLQLQLQHGSTSSSSSSMW